MHTVKDFTVRLACYAVRAYFIYMPVQSGKQWLWDRVVRPYIAWRRIPIEARARFGARFRGAMPNSIHTYLFFFGVWEPALSALFEALLQPGDLVIDVGANVGAHALLASHLVGPTGRVHAIEASPTIFAMLQDNVRLNRAVNVVTYNMAVADAQGVVSVFLHEESNLGATTIVADQAAQRQTRPETTVTAGPLHDIVPREVVCAARLIKIDVEGAEWLVIQGMAGLLRDLSDRTVIVIEVTRSGLDGFGVSFARLLQMLAEAGFKSYRINNEYATAFYFRPQAAELVPCHTLESDLVDLVFMRR